MGGRSYSSKEIEAVLRYIAELGKDWVVVAKRVSIQTGRFRTKRSVKYAYYRYHKEARSHNTMYIQGRGYNFRLYRIRGQPLLQSSARLDREQTTTTLLYHILEWTSSLPPNFSSYGAIQPITPDNDLTTSLIQTIEAFLQDCNAEGYFSLSEY